MIMVSFTCCSAINVTTEYIIIKNSTISSNVYDWFTEQANKDTIQAQLALICIHSYQSRVAFEISHKEMRHHCCGKCVLPSMELNTCHLKVYIVIIDI